ncbi:MAG: hypothetical protein P8Y36_08430, partial [Alphaproteobacteria bacterium]
DKIDIYKTFIDTAERTIERRMRANQFYFYVVAALVIAYAWLAESQWRGAAVVGAAAALLAGCLFYPEPASADEAHKKAATPLANGEIAVGWREFKPWIARLDHKSKPLWQKTISNESGALVKVTPLPDGHFVAGSMLYGGFGPAWAISFDLHGNILWKQNFGEGTYSISSMAALPNGSVLFAGGDSSGDRFARWAALVNSDGKLIWQRAFDSKGNVGTAYAIAPIKNGAIIAGQRWRTPFGEGYHSGEPWAARIGNNGEIIWSKDFGPDMSFPKAANKQPDYVLHSVEVTSGGKVILKGEGVKFVRGGQRKVATWQLRVGLDGNVTGKEYSAEADGHGDNSPLSSAEGGKVRK